MTNAQKLLALVRKRFADDCALDSEQEEIIDRWNKLRPSASGRHKLALRLETQYALHNRVQNSLDAQIQKLKEIVQVDDFSTIEQLKEFLTLVESLPIMAKRRRVALKNFVRQVSRD